MNPRILGTNNLNKVRKNLNKVRKNLKKLAEKHEKIGKNLKKVAKNLIKVGKKFTFFNQGQITCHKKSLEKALTMTRP